MARIAGIQAARKEAVDLFSKGWRARELGWTQADARAFYGPVGASGWSQANQRATTAPAPSVARRRTAKPKTSTASRKRSRRKASR